MDQKPLPRTDDDLTARGARLVIGGVWVCGALAVAALVVVGITGYR